MAELRLLQQGAHIDPAQFYRHELERAIRDIRNDFDELNDQQKREMEEWYKIKTEEITQQIAKRDALDSMVKVESPTNLKSALNENHREYNELKQLNADLVMRLSQLEEELDQTRRNNSFAIDQRERDIAEIRAKLQELMADYDELMNSKTSLEFEINTYRRLLESEETRTTRVNPPRPAYQPTPVRATATTQAAPNPAEFRVSTSEMSSKTTYQRTAKGLSSIPFLLPKLQFNNNNLFIYKKQVPYRSANAVRTEK